ncbi:FecCD family ABC transporter permease [Brevibacillus sp. B_LB10_24]|uniref:FecCD family ABC transporter permease n=1 Tax=Brevibacillus sp. B_LB10_24 TaxID=3380645 RepID=UPI0038BD8CAD
MRLENRSNTPFVYKLAAGILLLIGTCIAALILGAADTTFLDVWQALTSEASSSAGEMIREIRLPREMAAIIVGAALSVSGAIMQGITRNPLADPGLLGLTAGAKAALAVATVCIPSVGYFGTTVACFAGAAAGVLLVFGIGSLRKGGFAPFRIVLAGAAVSALLLAISEGIGIYYKISKEISMWTAGGLIGTTWSQLQAITPFIAAGILVSLLLSRQLTILSLSEEVAVGLGQKIVRIKMILFAVIIVLAGAAVAIVGNLAFIGLLVPHVARAIVGTDYRLIIPMSAVSGAVLMLVADTLGRTLQAPYETPVAAIVAIIGLPFFLWTVRKGGLAV